MACETLRIAPLIAAFCVATFDAVKLFVTELSSLQ